MEQRTIRRKLVALRLLRRAYRDRSDINDPFESKYYLAHVAMVEGLARRAGFSDNQIWLIRDRSKRERGER